MMAEAIRASFWPLRRIPQIQHFEHAVSACITTSSERLSFVAQPSGRRRAHFRCQGLRRRETLEEDASTQIGEDPKTRSRNEKKREARQAVRWGMDLASFSKSQIKRILRAASLEDEEIFGALMLAKRLGPDVREGKRRQFNYIGKLLRDAKPEILGVLIQATKEGDYSTIEAFSGAQKAELDDDEEETDESESEEEEEDEDTQQFVALANKWFDGLVNKDIEISNEVYSISDVEFDRQELRKLVRQVQSIEERQGNEENEEKLNAELKSAQRSLTRFLLGLAKQTPVEHYRVV